MISEFSYEGIKSGKGFIVFAVKPLRKSNVWFDVSKGLSKYENELKEKLLAVQPCKVDSSVLIFAMGIAVNSYVPNRNIMPKEWKEYLEKNQTKRMTVTDLIQEIWKDDF